MGVAHKGGPIRVRLTTAPARREGPLPRTTIPMLISALILGAAVALLALNVVDSADLRVGLAVSTAFLALALFLGTRLLRRHRRAIEPERALVVDDLGMSVVRGDNVEQLLRFRTRFGITVLSTARRDKVALAVTTPDGVVCAGADIAPEDLRRCSRLAENAVTVTTEDLTMATFLPSGDVLQLKGADLILLFETLITIDPGSVFRCYLSDARGHEVVLDGTALRTRRCTLYLDDPFEWRGWTFQEGGGNANASFQATWVRQGAEELVFVSLLGADVRRSIHDLSKSSGPIVDPMLLRDAQLAEVPLEHAPIGSTSIALDRLFMLPIRRALDRNHQVKRQSLPGDAPPP